MLAAEKVRRLGWYALCLAVGLSLFCRGCASSGATLAGFDMEDCNAFGADVKTAPQSCWEVQPPWADEQPAVALDHIGSGFCARIKEFVFSHFVILPLGSQSYHLCRGAPPLNYVTMFIALELLVDLETNAMGHFRDDHGD